MELVIGDESVSLAGLRRAWQHPVRVGLGESALERIAASRRA